MAQSSSAERLAPGERVLANGCFDLMHVGHANALRQAAEFGDLVVGLHDDKSVAQNKKAPPVLTEEERVEILSQLLFVVDVQWGIPYEQITDEVLDRVSCVAVAHGSDPVRLRDGSDMYQHMVAARKLRVFGRSPGVSTSQPVLRVLNSAGLRLAPEADRGEGGLQHFAAPGTVLRRFAALRDTYRGDVAGEDGKEKKKEEVVLLLRCNMDALHVGHIRAIAAAADVGRVIICLRQPRRCDAAFAARLAGQRSGGAATAMDSFGSAYYHSADEDCSRRSPTGLAVTAPFEQFLVAQCLRNVSDVVMDPMEPGKVISSQSLEALGATAVAVVGGSHLDCHPDFDSPADVGPGLKTIQVGGMSREWPSCCGIWSRIVNRAGQYLHREHVREPMHSMMPVY